MHACKTGWYDGRGAGFVGAYGSGNGMTYYYMYMGLLIIVLILWAIIAVREDDRNGGPPKGK